MIKRVLRTEYVVSDPSFTKIELLRGKSSYIGVYYEKGVFSVGPLRTNSL